MESKKIKFFDSHLHIIDSDFPLYENQGYLPEPFTTSMYLSQLSNYELMGGAIVSGSFQKQDQTYLLDALKKLGENYIGVTQLLANTPDETILSLDKAGVRAVRFNLKRGGSEDISKIAYFANRIYELSNWHVELYIDSTDLKDLFSTLIALPSVSIDHLGLNIKGFNTLLKLVEHGVKVKATGFGRVNFDPASAITAIYSANPNSLMFGTDLPSTRAPRPFEDNDISIITNNLGEEGINKILFQNAYDFYFKKHA